MNNSKFMELSNEEIMEVEGGCKTCRKVGHAIGWVFWGGVSLLFLL